MGTARKAGLRPLLVVLHRWLGLGTALFLMLAGLTGALIAWDHELDSRLNPAMFRQVGEGALHTPLALATALEAADPRIQVRYLPLALEPGHSLCLFVDPRPGQTLEVSQLCLDPASGAITGQRLWGAPVLDRLHLMPFIYKLHYSLHLPALGGFEAGIWLMGLVGMVWVLDSLVALVLSFPTRAGWRKSFAFRWKEGGYRFQFDLHRSGGVWLFPLLLVLATTSVAMNLGEQVMKPLVGWFSPLTPSPLQRTPPATTEPPMSREQAVALARQEARRRGWPQAAGGLFHMAPAGVYGVGFFAPGDDHGDGSLGNAWLYLDDRSGQLLGVQVPGEGSAGDVFMQSMFPLHSGRILGLPGRVLVSALGVGVAGLGLTGLIIWARKRRARRGAA
jgi:uncharacterized iron-regulated membrane protein